MITIAGYLLISISVFFGTLFKTKDFDESLKRTAIWPMILALVAFIFLVIALLVVCPILNNHYDVFQSIKQSFDGVDKDMKRDKLEEYETIYELDS
jgi:hypothetical protein